MHVEVFGRKIIERRWKDWFSCAYVFDGSTSGLKGVRSRQARGHELIFGCVQRIGNLGSETLKCIYGFLICRASRFLVCRVAFLH